MNSTIQTLINGYNHPAFLSDASDRHILFLNQAAEKEFGVPATDDTKSTLQDFFSSRKVIKQDQLWKRNKKEFEFHEEEVRIDDQEYILTVVKSPEDEQKPLDLFDLQKEMARLIVHRFHSPLNGVSGFTELLKNTDLDEKQSSYIESIEKGLTDFKEILSELKELAVDIEVQYSKIDVEKFSQDIANQFSEENKKRINILINPEIKEIRSDFVLLQKIVTELLNNALDFSAEPTGEISLHFRKDHRIRVTNFAKKIPDSFTHKMFYPFYSNKARGIGLGLPKSYYFAKELGYDIELSQNSSSKGISFDIRM